MCRRLQHLVVIVLRTPYHLPEEPCGIYPHCIALYLLTTSCGPVGHQPIAYSLRIQIPFTMSDQQQTISVPSLLLLAAFTALTIRYFFFGKSSVSPSRTNPRAANPADIEQIATMFPQIGRREIIWDLQRNGGSVAATTERILSRGSLDQVRKSAD